MYWNCDRVSLTIMKSAYLYAYQPITAFDQMHYINKYG